MSNALTVNAPQGHPYVDFTREFDAPVARVFAAYADPDMVQKWLGPTELEMSVEAYDFRTGGAYHYTHVDPEGNAYAFRGTFHTVRENESVVQTFEFLGFPDAVSTEFLTFEDLGDGRTRLTGHSVYSSLEARDGAVASGMETGMSEGFDQLDALLGAA